MNCVHKHTRQTYLPTNNTHIELQPIMNPMPEISDQLSPQPVQEILKSSNNKSIKIWALSVMQSPTSDILSVCWIVKSLKIKKFK